MNVLFLYSEVAGYFLSAAKMLVTRHHYKVHIVTRPPNPEAPYDFPQEDGIVFYGRKEMDTQKIMALYTQLNPVLVYISGWNDKQYLQAARKIRKDKVPVICSCDNPWRGDLRQYLAGIFLRRFLHKRFSHILIAGMYQYPLASHLGFKRKQVLTGMNTADLSVFHKAYHDYRGEKEKKYPHNFLYVGRFVEIKGLQELVSAFVELQREKDHDWTLTLVGAGHLKESLTGHPNVFIKDFVQPQHLGTLAQDAGCFILPSRIEPWGVVIHEFCGAGLPLVTSNICGASTAFVRPGHNGFMHEPNEVAAIKEVLWKVIRTPDTELLEMGDRSHLLSYHFSPESWASNLLNLQE
ncbi:MAG: glycosyltransferase family 4 protein [Sediminicola sp.]